jgi:hypothetical protein
MSFDDALESTKPHLAMTAAEKVVRGSEPNPSSETRYAPFRHFFLNTVAIVMIKERERLVGGSVDPQYQEAVMNVMQVLSEYGALETTVEHFPKGDNFVLPATEGERPL